MTRANSTPPESISGCLIRLSRRGFGYVVSASSRRAVKACNPKGGYDEENFGSRRVGPICGRGRYRTRENGQRKEGNGRGCAAGPLARHYHPQQQGRIHIDGSEG